jgi:hypothetical protein
MRAVVTSAVTRFAPEKQHGVRGAQLFGLFVASVLPAVVWCALINAVAVWISGPLSLRVTLITGFAIALFLAVVCAPLILRDRE